MSYPINSVALRYAKALFQLAVANQKLEQIHTDMYGLYQLFLANRRLVAILKSPLITQDKKLAVLHTLFQERVNVLTLKFFTMVIQKNRTEQLPAMTNAFLVVYDRHRAIVTAQVTTTYPLSESLAGQLKQMVQQITACQQVQLEQRIDPSLIGGYILQVEDKRIDQSLRGKLHSLQKHCVTKSIMG